jgi:hypothetical protein
MPIEKKDAERIGGGITIQSLLLVFTMVELFFLVKATRSDFANGILFFIFGQLNPFEIVGVAVLFSLTYFLGRNAGKEILLNGGDWKRVGVKHALLTIGLFAGIVLAICAAHNGLQSAWDSIIFLILVFSISILLAWLWAVWRIKQVQKNGQNNVGGQP